MSEDDDDFDHELELTVEDDGPSALDKLTQMEAIINGFSQNPGYKPEYCILARKLCAQLGATTADLAEFIGVEITTIKRWMVRYPEFGDATKVGKKVANEAIAKSLYQRGMGYSIKTEKLFHTDGKITRAWVMEHIPAELPSAARHGLIISAGRRCQCRAGFFRRGNNA